MFPLGGARCKFPALRSSSTNHRLDQLHHLPVREGFDLLLGLGEEAKPCPEHQEPSIEGDAWRVDAEPLRCAGLEHWASVSRSMRGESTAGWAWIRRRGRTGWTYPASCRGEGPCRSSSRGGLEARGDGASRNPRLARSADGLGLLAERDGRNGPRTGGGDLHGFTSLPDLSRPGGPTVRTEEVVTPVD